MLLEIERGTERGLQYLPTGGEFPAVLCPKCIFSIRTRSRAVTTITGARMGRRDPNPKTAPRSLPIAGRGTWLRQRAVPLVGPRPDIPAIVVRHLHTVLEEVGGAPEEVRLTASHEGTNGNGVSEPAEYAHLRHEEDGPHLPRIGPASSRRAWAEINRRGWRAAEGEGIRMSARGVSGYRARACWPLKLARLRG